MNRDRVLLAAALCSAAFGQNGVLMVTDSTWKGVAVNMETTLYPPTPPMAQGFVGGAITDTSGIHRYLFYNSEKRYFGYNLQAEPVPNTAYFKVTFRPLTEADPKRLEIPDAEGWTKVALSGYPAPQMAQAGDSVELELFRNPATGQRIFDHVRVMAPKGKEKSYVLGVTDTVYINLINHPDASGVFVIRPDGTIPMARFGEVRGAAGMTVESLTAALEERYSLYFNNPKVNVRIIRINPPNASGAARDLALSDVELRLIVPQIFLNGKHVNLATYEDGVVGPIVWFYLPEHGRYALSLMARPQLGFTKAGDVRGSMLTFTIDGETLGLTSGVNIAPGYAPYNLYVLRESGWRPKEVALAGTFLMGTTESADGLLQTRQPKLHEIVAGDVLYVNVLHQPEVSGNVSVRPDGMVSLLGGEVKASGMSPQQLAGVIKERLAKYFNSPEVNIQVVQANSDKKYYVTGEVRKAGEYSFKNQRTVLEAINLAGGPAEFAKKKAIYVLRDKQKLPFNFLEVSKGKSLEQNIVLQNGDVIVVP